MAVTVDYLGMPRRLTPAWELALRKRAVGITFAELRVLIRSTVAVKRPSPLKMSVLSAKKQKISRAIKWFMSCRRSASPQLGFSSST